jgi:phage baseplate assembly protein gpV
MTASRDNDAMSKGRAQTPGAQYEANKKPQAHNNKAYSLFPGAAESYMEAVKDYEINARDAATAAFSEKDAKIKADDKNSFTWPKSTRGPPPGIDTTSKRDTEASSTVHPH